MNKEVEPLEPVQINIYQSNIHRKDLSWLYYDDEPMVQEAPSEGTKVLHIRFCSLSNNSKEQLGGPAQA